MKQNCILKLKEPFLRKNAGVKFSQIGFLFKTQGAIFYLQPMFVFYLIFLIDHWPPHGRENCYRTTTVAL